MQITPTITVLLVAAFALFFAALGFCLGWAGRAENDKHNRIRRNKLRKLNLQ